ncbi:hypothetical protein AC578_2724 [Pseudocercospora eumusae]|uniref:Major facilitator superfamily (MFS) profile domain-containing protein n=1 Tax=Pseudocercospora eumusae TaxID=321146 RepID=A0A139HGX0_9PEZI|nr:hypothetical protein AC578_2724 [Pseudocercospora eumusae]
MRNSHLVEIMDHLTVVRGWDFVPACRCVFVLYAVIGVLKIMLSASMSSLIEAEEQGQVDDGNDQAAQEILETTEPGDVSQQADAERTPLLPATVPKLAESENKRSSIQAKGCSIPSSASKYRAERILMYKLLPLMGTDSCAVGMSSVQVTPVCLSTLSPWQTYFVRTKFNVSDGPLGLIFFLANILGACGTISSNALVRRMGNLITVAATYIPAGILIALFGIPKNIQ